jgi:hypothetical protein
MKQQSLKSKCQRRSRGVDAHDKHGVVSQVRQFFKRNGILHRAVDVCNTGALRAGADQAHRTSYDVGDPACTMDINSYVWLSIVVVFQESECVPAKIL